MTTFASLLRLKPAFLLISGFQAIIGTNMPNLACVMAPNMLIVLVPRSEREPLAQDCAETQSPPTFLNLLRLVETPAGCSDCKSTKFLLASLLNRA